MITSSSMCSTYCAMTSQWFLLTTPAPAISPAALAILASLDSSETRFSALIRQRLTGMILVSLPGLCWSGVLQHCIASAMRMNMWESENPYVWPVPHIRELGLCVGPVPQLWQMLRCRRSLDPLYNCYFGFKILWDVWCRKAGVSNTAQTKNTRNEQVFCWLW